MFRLVFSLPTYHRFLVLGRAAILTTGCRTVTNVRRTVRSQAQGPVSSSHQVCSQRRWSTWALARALITYLLDQGVPPGPALLAGDDTVPEHPGPKVFGQGRHRDGGRSSHRDTAYRWGHQWGGMSVLVTFPFATRRWALPIWVALSCPPEWDRRHGMRHQTPAHLARLLLARLIRWCPHRHVSVMGDTGYGTRETARCWQQHHRHLTVVRQLYGDAALYEPPPPRTRHTRGRPRVKGQKLASPHGVVAHTAKRISLTVAWYGGASRDIEVVTGTGHWYRIGGALVDVRWVYLHDCTGTHRDESFLATAMTMKPPRSVACYTPRWSIETTCPECREYLKLVSTMGYGPTARPPIHPVLVWTLHDGCDALSSALAPRKDPPCRVLEGQIAGAVFRYDDVCTPCTLGAVVCSHPG
jgi:hypothetical protein